MGKSFVFTNHYAHQPVAAEAHDAYALMCNFSIPVELLNKKKTIIVERLQQDICADIDKYINIGTPSFLVTTLRFTFHIHVYDPSISTMIKLRYG